MKFGRAAQNFVFRLSEMFPGEILRSSCLRISDYKAPPLYRGFACLFGMFSNMSLSHEIKLGCLAQSGGSVLINVRLASRLEVLMIVPASSYVYYITVSYFIGQRATVFRVPCFFLFHRKTRISRTSLSRGVPLQMC